MTQHIQTKRLILRPMRPDDLAALFEVYSDTQAMKYWDRLPHEDPTVTQGLVDGMISLGPDARYLVIEHQGRAIGTGGFWQGNEVGYILHRDVWGQGLGGEVLRAFVGLGFDVYGFDHLTAEVDPRNAVSLRMLKSAGFVETGRARATLQVGGIWVDSVYLRCDRA